jgi:hypothetical protein
MIHRADQDDPSTREDANAPGGVNSADRVKEEEKDLVIDESTLAPYLFKRDDFQKIKKIVDPYKPVASGSVPSVRNGKNLVQFIESTINGAMKMSVHAPGRKFKVSIVDSKDMNAFMTGDSRMGLHLGTIAKSDENEILAVICHEMAHSARNHAYRSAQEPNVRLPRKLLNQLNNYIGTQFDRNRATYVHNEKDYILLKKEWDEAIFEFETLAKKDESEADLIGAKICGNMGMDAQLYHNSIVSLFKKAGGDARPLKIKDGSTFANVTQNAMFKVLFPIFKHPTHEERDQQLSRLKSLLKTSSLDQDSTFYKSWIAGVEDPLEKARGKNLSLTNTDAPSLWIRDEKTGEVINLDQPFGGCSHSGIDVYALIPQR